MATNRLFSCPFCNSSNVSWCLGEGQKEFHAFVQCNDCMAQGSCIYNQEYQVAIQESINKWNSRIDFNIIYN